MELNITSEATICVAAREIPSNLCNPKIYYRIHKCFPLVPTLNHTNPPNTPILFLQDLS
jgi:hypothetical protein